MRVSTLIASTVAVAATSTIGGLATRPAVQSVWYRQLRKPPYQPPRAVFPVVWPLLYADIAIVSASTVDRLRDGRDEQAAGAYLQALGLNLVHNAAWSWLFFQRRHLAGAVALNVALTASSADLTRRAVAGGGTRAAWLALYPAWCAFATLLSAHIWRLNRRKSGHD